MTALLGCIADDFTGATDLAGVLVRAGMRTVHLIGGAKLPKLPSRALADVDAIVIALRSRTCPVDEAIRESVAALRWLQNAGCMQFFFKYCPNFDAAPEGNIWPVTEALMKAAGIDFTVVCAALPAGGRTVYKGYLFIGDVLLSESGMRDHPATPIADANLVRLLQQQVKGRVGLVEHGNVALGPVAIAERMAALRREGYAFAVVDGLSERDLQAAGAACAELPLVTGDAGMALGLPENFRRRGLLPANATAHAIPAGSGLRAVIAGSCSAATCRQVARMREQCAAFHISPLQLAHGDDVVGAALDWAAQNMRDAPVLIYATAAPESVRQVQAQLGVERACRLVEEAMAAIAKGLVKLGVGQLIVAGGETSGAVVKALGVTLLRVGPEIDPGVPWTVAMHKAAAIRPLTLALKSGNFGSDDFFLKAWSVLG